MARKRGNKRTLTCAQRSKMYRQRKKLQRFQNRRIENYFDQTRSEEINQSETSAIETLSNDVNLNEQIRMWANKHRISKIALNELLHILKSNGLSLPVNYSTLQETPMHIDIMNVAGGQLWHNGLQNCLEKIFAKLAENQTISLTFNIDGLPVYKSSKITFWPILASIYGL